MKLKLYSSDILQKEEFLMNLGQLMIDEDF